MAATTVNVRAGLSKNVTLHVRLVGQRRWAVRVWIATRLFWTAAWVLGCNVAVDTVVRREPPTEEECDGESEPEPESEGADH